jgi:hypothetical protein
VYGAPQRNPQIRADAGERIREVRRHRPDDRALNAIDDERCVRGNTTGKLPARERIAQDDDGMV